MQHSLTHVSHRRGNRKEVAWAVTGGRQHGVLEYRAMGSPWHRRIIVAVVAMVFAAPHHSVDAFGISRPLPRLAAPRPTSSSSTSFPSTQRPDDARTSSSSPSSSTALRAEINTGDTVVCKISIPTLGIYENSSYEVTSMYVQYFNDETQTVVKRPVKSLGKDADGEDIIVAAAAQQGQKKMKKNEARLYVTLYSPRHHTGGRDAGAVVVAPEEVGMISVRDELGNAVWLAVPGFFWVYVAVSLYGTYHERTGGSIGDAFMGR